MPPPITLEITVAPVDLPVARHTLGHQMRQWAGQVSDVQFTLDLHTSRGRYGAAAEERRPGMVALLDDLCVAHPNARVEVVDYGSDARQAVAERFFGGRSVPAKHHYGGPVYSYFYGWHAARHDLVLHLDCDMLFGGGSQTWVDEAVRLLRSRDDTVLVNPFPGPPRADGSFPDAVMRRHEQHAGVKPRRVSVDPPAYVFPGASTRLFLFDRAEFGARLGPLPLERPRLRSFARALAEGHPPYELPEVTISRLMQTAGLGRLDLLGAPPGMWSLHPALRSNEFYEALPDLIRRVEQDDVPEAQRGDYDLNDSMVDWSSARAAQRHQTWWRRLARRWLPSRS